MTSSGTRWRPRGRRARDDPNDPAYRWSRYDRVVDGLARRGIAAIFNVYRSPSWANGGRGPAWAPSEADYGAFMTALARRYDGVTPDRDGLVHGPVELFQAWNEPNIPRFLQPQWQTDAGGGHTARLARDLRRAAEHGLAVREGGPARTPG